MSHGKIYGTKYSRMGPVKFVEDMLLLGPFLKTLSHVKVLHIFHVNTKNTREKSTHVALISSLLIFKFTKTFNVGI